MTRSPIDFGAARRSLDSSRRALLQSLEPDEATIAAIYRQRAERLARRETEVDLVPPLDVLVCRLGGERCAIELTRMAEVMPLRALTPVPGTPPEIAGVVNLRGDIRPVLDIAAAFGGEGAGGPEKGSGAYAVFLRRDGPEVGLRVDGVETVTAVDRNDLAPLDQEDTTLPLRFARGLTADGLVVLDVDAVVALIAGAEGPTGPRGEGR